ncbi:MAG TPA: hypothetical protein VFT39_06805 [Vicinamibacterales bacterium]|nr:hypothetical protein [Vicinamibacterales bacterium]
MKSTQFLTASAALSVAIGVLLHARQAPTSAADTSQDRVAALKQSLQQGMAAIRRYQWVETTSISLKGEEKSRQQQNCHYVADGKVQKTPIGEPAPQQQKAQSGGRGRGRLKAQIVEKKKDEMKDYMVP